ncbi:MAG TPA: hypothetical protein VGL82_12640 [Bryobacteraceae bacterium]|jgi:hypothetical protein
MKRLSARDRSTSDRAIRLAERGDELSGLSLELLLGKQLSIRQRSGLRRQCSAAKEILLCDPHRESVEISVLGAGSSLIGGTLKTEITRADTVRRGASGLACPTHILFNGGVLHAQFVRTRLLGVLSDPFDRVSKLPCL